MGFLEKRVTAALLSAIRIQRQTRSHSSGLRRAGHSRVPRSARLREALFSDFTGVADLKRSWGLTPDSLENWERFWRRNPALQRMETQPPMGWVLESDGEIVGYLGNISVLYQYGDRQLTAAISHGMVVRPEYRAASLSLVSAFYRQKAADLYLVTTAIEAVGKLARAFKSRALPQPNYDSVLFWVVEPNAFAKVLMKKLRAGPAIAYLGMGITTAAAQIDKMVRRRVPKACVNAVSIRQIELADIGDDFQRLWSDKVKEKTQLLSDRDPGTLKWHFSIPDDNGTVGVLCCHRDGALVGYTIIRHEAPNQITGLRRSLIADTLIKQDDRQVLKALWAAAYDEAKRAGSHVLEVLGFPDVIRQACAEWNPYIRKYPAYPFYYRAADPVLHEVFAKEAAWYVSPFDGDTTLVNFGTESE